MDHFLTSNLFFSYMNCRKSQILRLLNKTISVDSFFYNTYETPNRIYKEIFINNENGWSYPWDINFEEQGICQKVEVYNDFNSAETDLMKTLGDKLEVYIWIRNKYIPHMKQTQSHPDGIHSITLTQFHNDQYQVVDYPFEHMYSSDIIKAAFNNTPKEIRTLTYISLDNYYQDSSAAQRYNKNFQEKILNSRDEFDSYDALILKFEKKDNLEQLINRSIQFLGVISLSRALTGIFMESNQYSEAAVQGITEISKMAEIMKNYFLKISVNPKLFNKEQLIEKFSKLKKLEINFFNMMELEILTGIKTEMKKNVIEPITNLKVLGQSDTSVLIGWGDESGEHQLIDYEIYINDKFIGSTTSHQYLIDNLNPHSQYEVSIIKKQLQQKSDPVSITTLTEKILTSGNLALYKPVYASSIEGEEFTFIHVIDNNPSTRWSSQYTDNEWIYVDLGMIKEISRIRLHWEGACASEYKIECSEDALTWKVIKYVQNGIKGVYEVNNLDIQTRFVKITGIARATIFGYSLWELSVFN